MTTALQRNPITEALLTQLRTIGHPIGDGQIPPGTMWVGGVNTPGSTYVPFAVCSELAASHSWGPIGDPQADWQLPYLVEAFGISRHACGWMTAKCIDAALAMRPMAFTINGVSYGVQYVHIDEFAAPVRDDSVAPPVWRSQGAVTLWIGKGS